MSSSGVTEYKHYIRAAGKTIAEHSKRTNGITETNYLIRDNQGSVVAIAKGSSVTHLDYDAFGARRPVIGLGHSVINTIVNDLSRGYTGHEMLDNVGIIHMNGRVYDPKLGRFLSADPVVQQPNNLQNLNRYSYVLNNPMLYTDPSGYSFWTKVLRPVLKFAIAAAIAYYTPIPGFDVWGMVFSKLAINSSIAVALFTSGVNDLNGVKSSNNTSVGIEGSAEFGSEQSNTSAISSEDEDEEQAENNGGNGGSDSGNSNTPIPYAPPVDDVIFGHNLNIMFFNSDADWSEVFLNDGEYTGEFDGSKVGVNEGFNLYAQSPQGAYLNMLYGETVSVIYNEGEPTAGGSIIYWDGRPRYPSRGMQTVDMIVNHEIGHLNIGGHYADTSHPDHAGFTNMGNVERENEYLNWRGYGERTGYLYKGNCYAPSGELGGVCN